MNTCKTCCNLDASKDKSCAVLFFYVTVDTDDPGIIAVRVHPEEDFGCIYWRKR